MRVVYLGTPDFAILPLQAIYDSGLVEIIAVCSNKDKPVGRKQELKAPPVKERANELGIQCFQFDKISLEGVEVLRGLKPDLLITCAFGQILSKEVLDVPKLGVFNIHASLLPKYRGASPIHYAILNGEQKTGITIMKTELGIDTGDIIYQKSLDIMPNETCGSLFNRLSVLGSECIVKVLRDAINDNLVFKKQDESSATNTKMIKKIDALIDFSKTNIEVVNQIRAFNPAPIAYTLLNGLPFKVFEAEAVNGEFDYSKPATVLCNDKKLLISCGVGAISLIKVQKAGGKPIGIRDFLSGNKPEIGFEFGK